MNLENNTNTGFTIIEIDIYAELKWDYDLIIKCLSYLQVNFNRIANIDNSKIEVYLIRIINFLGQDYPALGLRIKEEIANEFVIDKLETNIKKWIEQNGGTNRLLDESSELQAINWKTLQEVSYYPLID